MKCKQLGVFFAWIVLPLSGAAEDHLRVDEASTRLQLLSENTTLSLALVNELASPIPAGIEVELLDPRGEVRTAARLRDTIEPGTSIVTLELEPPLSRLSSQDRAQVLLFRLRYTLRPDAYPTTEGIVSVLSIAESRFNLSLIYNHWVVPGQVHRVTVRGQNAVTSEVVGDIAIEGNLELPGLERTLTSTAVTDTDGIAILEFPVPSPSLRRGAKAKLSVRGLKGGLAIDARDDVEILQDIEVLVTTDRPLYPPGQTLHVRAAVHSISNAAISDAKARVTITREGEKIFFARAETSRFGVTSVDWDIPENTHLGDYDILVELEDEAFGDARGEAKVKLSRYELGTFSVAVEPDRPYYLHGQDAVINVRAEDHLGQPISNGQLVVFSSPELEWNHSLGTWKIEYADSFVHAGRLKPGGNPVPIDLSTHHRELAECEPFDSGCNRTGRFEDIDFLAAVTDPTTGRTEHQRFRLRISKEPIHVYT